MSEKIKFNYGDVPAVNLDRNKAEKYDVKLLSVHTSKGNVPINDKYKYNQKSEMFREFVKMFQSDMQNTPNFEDAWRAEIIKRMPQLEDKWDENSYLRLQCSKDINMGTYSPYEILPDKYVYTHSCNEKFWLMIAIMNITGKPGDSIEVEYEKMPIIEKEAQEAESEIVEKVTHSEKYDKYIDILMESKNIIFRGAPGTGKSYLANQIAALIASNGRTLDKKELSEDEKKQIEFVQFHPSYDYTDFIEGLRPVVAENGEMGFELQDGIFKKFVQKAADRIEKTTNKSIETIWNDFIETIGDGEEPINNYKFHINSRGNVTYNVPGGSSASMTLDNVKEYLLTGKWGHHNYHSTYKQAIFDKYLAKETKNIKIEKNDRKYVFIIDEINRGEISKIFGELFFSLDPNYRGLDGAVSTQYSNLHENPDEKFYIPENVYIIGTMNDIDRSVDSFDFAMRRRFRFIEIKASDGVSMLTSLEDLADEAGRRMNALNQAISKVDELNDNYHIGAAYFLKLEKMGFDDLWSDYLEPLLQEYVRGVYGDDKILADFKKAYYETGDDDNDGNED